MATWKKPVSSVQIYARLRFGIDVSHGEVRWEGENLKKEIRNREEFLMQIYKRERKIWQVKNSKFLEMHFFSLANFLGVAKSQDLAS